MGGAQSQTINETLDTFQQSVTNVLENLSSSASAQEANINQVLIAECPTYIGINCPIVVNQNINASQTAKFLATFSSANDVTSKLDSIVQQFVTISSSATTGFMAAAFEYQDQEVNLSSTITQIIQNNIDVNQVNQMIASLKNLNDSKFLLCGYNDCGGKGFSVNQDIIAQQTSRMITKMCAQAMMKNTDFSKYVSDVTAKQTSTQKGLDDLIANLGLFMLMPILIILAIVFLPGLLKGSPKTIDTSKLPGSKNLNLSSKGLKKI